MVFGTNTEIFRSNRVHLTKIINLKIKFNGFNKNKKFK